MRPRRASLWNYRGSVIAKHAGLSMGVLMRIDMTWWSKARSRKRPTQKYGTASHQNSMESCSGIILEFSACELPCQGTAARDGKLYGFQVRCVGQDGNRISS